jgi:hypothetical protein
LLLGYVESWTALSRAHFKEIRLGIGPRIWSCTSSRWTGRILSNACVSQLVAVGGRLAERYLRSYDALPLATAWQAHEPVIDTVRLSTWDKELAEAALAAGLGLAHEVSN